MNTNGPIVIYHASCWDGFCAAWLLGKAFPDAEYHAAHYGTDPPDSAEDKSRRLFIVDFSYPRDVMFRLGAMRSRASMMTVLDHHKTAEAALKGLSQELMFNNLGRCECVFDMSKSGGRLTWEYIYGNRLLPDEWLEPNKSGYSLSVAPWLVDYTEDRDLWRWKLPESRAINAGIRSFPLTIEQWDIMHEAGPAVFQADGSAILRREAQIVDQHVRHAREIELGGHKILAVNATVLFSDIAGKLSEDRPFGACYFDRGGGKQEWSLRSRDGGVDVSEIARQFGGGGHRNAAGFERILTDI